VQTLGGGEPRVEDLDRRRLERLGVIEREQHRPARGQDATAPLRQARGAEIDSERPHDPRRELVGRPDRLQIDARRVRGQEAQERRLADTGRAEQRQQPSALGEGRPGRAEDPGTTDDVRFGGSRRHGSGGPDCGMAPSRGQPSRDAPLLAGSSHAPSPPPASAGRSGPCSPRLAERRSSVRVRHPQKAAAIVS
jgi:hypothetical protein